MFTVILTRPKIVHEGFTPMRCVVWPDLLQHDAEPSVGRIEHELWRLMCHWQLCSPVNIDPVLCPVDSSRWAFIVSR